MLKLVSRENSSHDIFTRLVENYFMYPHILSSFTDQMATNVGTIRVTMT